MINYELIHAPSLFDGEAFLLEQTLLINRDNDLIEAVFNPKNREDRKAISTLSPNIPQSTITGILTPGFIDLQVNGGGGILFNDEPTLDGLKTILNAHLSIGTHALLPTLITPTDEVIMQALDAIEAGIKANLNGLLGIHLEGPMINPLRKGIHKEENIHIPSEAVLTRLIEANGRFGHILITLAPETVPMVLIKRLTDAGITVFAGHTKADPDTLNAAKLSGLSGFTHLYNAMPPMESRNPGTLGFAITDETSYASIIHDGYHIDPIMVKLAIEAKPDGKLFLITDAMATTGSDLKKFILDGKEIYYNKGRLVDHNGTLAGAHLSLATAVINTHQLGYSLEKSIKMASLYPAMAIQNTHYGKIKKGYRAAFNRYDEGQFFPL